MWLVTVLAFFIGIQGALTGVLRVRRTRLTGRETHADSDTQGCGQQRAAANANLFSYWSWGLPIGAFLAYKTRNIEGLLAGKVTFCSSGLVCADVMSAGVTLAVITTSAIMMWIIHRSAKFVKSPHVMQLMTHAETTGRSCQTRL